MASAGSITPSTGDKISDKTWQQILISNVRFLEIKSVAITNPGTGEKVEMTSPPNKLAEFISDGQRNGVIWMPVHAFELGFEGDGDEFTQALVTAAEIVGGEIEQY